MNINLANNIRELRKQQGLTQEQLAEALGVTVGAVYKWENARSTPDVTLIMELADMFQVSVDALLGYEVRNNDKEHIVARLKRYIYEHVLEEALQDAEKALKKYPNSFEIVYYSAELYGVRGIELENAKFLKRALELFQHADLLFVQNTDDTISPLDIKIQMAQMYTSMGETDKALEILKKNNFCRMNSDVIGYTLASDCNRIDEALPYLSEALTKCVVEQINVVMGYLNVFVKKKDFNSALEILKWVLATYPQLKKTGEPSFLNKSEALFLALSGEVYALQGQNEQAKEYLRQAKQVAAAFDENPSYSTERIRFTVTSGKFSGHDNLGDTAMEGIEKIVLEQNHEEFTKLWEEVKYEKMEM